MAENEFDRNNKAVLRRDASHDSDIVSFWLLLLFVAVFFGIAAEESRRPMFSSASQSPFGGALADETTIGDSRNHNARRFDLSSIDENGNRGPIGSRAEKFEAPATGK